MYFLSGNTLHPQEAPLTSPGLGSGSFCSACLYTPELSHSSLLLISKMRTSKGTQTMHVIITIILAPSTQKMLRHAYLVQMSKPPHYANEKTPAQKGKDIIQSRRTRL